MMLGVFARETRPRFVVVDPMQYFPNQLELVKENLMRHGMDLDAVDIRATTSETAFRGAQAESLLALRKETASKHAEITCMDDLYASVLLFYLKRIRRKPPLS